MGDDLILVRPGKGDINGQFTAGAKIRKTRRLYDRISNNGDYKFGELTSFFYSYDEDQDDAWQDDIKNNYSQNIINQIKGHVITVLSKIDPKDPHPSISLKFIWNPSRPERAELTQAGDAHTITIYGHDEPANTSFVDRQKSKSE